MQHIMYSSAAWWIGQFVYSMLLPLALELIVDTVRNVRGY